MKGLFYLSGTELHRAQTQQECVFASAPAPLLLLPSCNRLFGLACLDAAIWVALLDDVERRESGLCSLEVQRGQCRAAGHEPLDPGPSDLGAIHEDNLLCEERKRNLQGIASQDRLLSHTTSVEALV